MENRSLLPKIRVVLRVTSGCDIKCSHCYVTAGEGNIVSLSEDEIKAIIDELANIPQVYKIIFSGGQATLLGKSLLRCISYAKGKDSGFESIELDTNAGIGRSDTTAEFWISHLKASGLDLLRMSSDSYHREYLHEDYENRVVDWCKKVQLPLKILTVVSPDEKLKDNFHTQTEDGIQRKFFALRPGGRSLSDDLYSSNGYSDISACRIWKSRRTTEKVTIYINQDRKVHICNAGVYDDVCQGKILDKPLHDIIFGSSKKIFGLLAEQDVEGFFPYLDHEEVAAIQSDLKEIGRCATCLKWRTKVSNRMRIEA